MYYLYKIKEIFGHKLETVPRPSKNSVSRQGVRAIKKAKLLSACAAVYHQPSCWAIMALLSSKVFCLYNVSRCVLSRTNSRLFSASQHHLKASINIGFIGLGNMGGPMALNLLNKGHSVVVYDVSEEAMKRLEDQGASAASTPSEVASKVDRLITMLPNSQHVLTCYTGDKGVFQSVQPGTLILDSSTIDPLVSKQMAGLATKKGAVFMDAPVSGGVNAAKGGTLTFMVGGEEKEFEAAKGLLSAMGKNVVYCGQVGNGQAVKICNNMLLAITMIGTAETMNLGMRLGLEPKLLASIINTATGRCWASELYNPVPGVLDNVPSSNNYEGGFGTALMTKDLGLAQAAATNTQSPTPLGSLSHQIYRLMCNSNLGEKDFSSIFLLLQENNK